MTGNGFAGKLRIPAKVNKLKMNSTMDKRSQISSSNDYSNSGRRPATRDNARSGLQGLNGMIGIMRNGPILREEGNNTDIVALKPH